MRRIILLSTVLFATPFGIDCYAEDCVNSNCQTLGYTYPTNIGGCLQCPFGNYWFCPGNDDYCPNLGTLDSCPKGYKCEYEECSGKYYKVDGCQDSYVWDAEAKTCTCPNLGTLDSCPKGYKCVYEACSGKYYKVDGCQDSYVWDANAKTCTCPNKGNLSSCPTGYKCVYEACSGKYYKVDGCASGYDWNASSKTCTEHCYYSCSLASCPAHGNCSYENCTGKYCLYSCQTGYNLEGNSCVCPNKIVPENIAYTVVRLVIILKVILVSALISALSLPAQPVGNVIKNLVRVNIVLSNVLPVMILLTEIVSYINILLAAPEVILKKISGVIMLKKQVKFVQPATHQFMDNIVIKDQIAEYAPFQEKEFEYTTHVQLLARNSQMDMLPVCIIGMFVELTKVILVSVEQHIGQKIIQQKLNV